jgi:hypothetical protein
VVAGISGINLARAIITESIGIIGDCNLSPGFTESVVRCTTKVIYNLYHRNGANEQDEGIEIQKFQHTSEKFFEFLLSRVPPQM